MFCCGTTVKLVNYKFTVNPRLTLDRFLGLASIAVCVVAGCCLIFLALPNRASSGIAVAIVSAVLILVMLIWYRQRTANHPRLERVFPVCERHRFQNAFVYVAWATLLATLGLRSFEILPDSAYFDYLFYPVFLLNAFLSKSLAATRYQSGHFWISGCGKRYCDGLPNWGGSSRD